MAAVDTRALVLFVLIQACVLALPAPNLTYWHNYVTEDGLAHFTQVRASACAQKQQTHFDVA